ncbi:MAG: polyphosphate kinase 2 family protein [Alphaproteobacteria bacterium]|nr:polyphosphate kinase 2 family protein [Alphaproteobacteria bacterium]
MRRPVDSPYLVPSDGFFRVAEAATLPPPDAPGRKTCRRALKARVNTLSDLQRRLHADGRYAVLLIFQALDAAGKDSTIRKVLSGVNPAGCQVFSFGMPSSEALRHDYLWRTSSRLPERGRIGVFNRSYYEEVLAVRVHPERLASQRLPPVVDPERIWEHRFESIRDHERHLTRNGVILLKFWLNVSREEQGRRILRRLQDPSRNWKFSPQDLFCREHWGEYMLAYEELLNATSRPWAPWYAIPADDKPYMRMAVADIVVRTVERLNLHYPQLAEDARAQLEETRLLLERELDPEQPAAGLH